MAVEAEKIRYFRHVDANLVCQLFAFFLGQNYINRCTSAHQRDDKQAATRCATRAARCDFGSGKSEKSGKMPNNEKLSNGKMFSSLLKLPSSAENVFSVATFGSC